MLQFDDGRGDGQGRHAGNVVHVDSFVGCQGYVLVRITFNGNFFKLHFLLLSTLVDYTGS